MYLHEALHAAGLRPVRRAGWGADREPIVEASWTRWSGDIDKTGSKERITIARMLVTLAGRDQYWPSDADLGADDWVVCA